MFKKSLAVGALCASALALATGAGAREEPKPKQPVRIVEEKNHTEHVHILKSDKDHVTVLVPVAAAEPMKDKDAHTATKDVTRTYPIAKECKLFELKTVKGKLEKAPIKMEAAEFLADPKHFAKYEHHIDLKGKGKTGAHAILFFASDSPKAEVVEIVLRHPVVRAKDK